MNSQETLSILARLKPELVRRFGVTRLALFGSTVRKEARHDSDVVVNFDGLPLQGNILVFNFY